MFAANNPIRFIDEDGRGAGDPFKTLTEAAKDFGKTYNDNSIRDNKEYITVIIKVVKDGKVYYKYNTPIVSGAASANLKITAEEELL